MSFDTARAIDEAELAMRQPQGSGRAGVVRQISKGGHDKQYAADEPFDLIEGSEVRVSSSR